MQKIHFVLTAILRHHHHHHYRVLCRIKCLHRLFLLFRLPSTCSSFIWIFKFNGKSICNEINSTRTFLPFVFFSVWHWESHSFLHEVFRVCCCCCAPKLVNERTVHAAIEWTALRSTKMPFASHKKCERVTPFHWQKSDQINAIRSQSDTPPKHTVIYSAFYSEYLHRRIHADIFICKRSRIFALHFPIVVAAAINNFVCVSVCLRDFKLCK